MRTYEYETPVGIMTESELNKLASLAKERAEKASGVTLRLDRVVRVEKFGEVIVRFVFLAA